MIDQKTIKKEAKKSIKKHYFRSIILVFVCSLLLAGGFNFTTKNIIDVPRAQKEASKIINNKKISGTEVLDEIEKKLPSEKQIKKDIKNKYTNGAISYIINETTSSCSLVFAILNGINKVVFEGKIGSAVLIFISTILLILFTIIYINTLEVGEKRYFLEKRRYIDTKIDRLIYPYKVKKTFHMAYILFMKSLYQVLWCFTIIGGFIKYYEYSLIPYILAENPKINKKEAFRISKELTNGNKLKLFYLDLSLIGWGILKLCTFNLSGIFFSDIYKEAIHAEVYMTLRNKVNLDNNDRELLNDSLLDIEKSVNEEYPEERYKVKTRKWLKVDFNKDYSIKTYILFFFTFSFVGWIWEVFYNCLNNGTFVNRGTMHGPWLPIYGFGGLLILILLKKFRNKPVLLFISAFILCGVLEYSTAWYLETFKHLRYWDYTGYFLNINGRICLEGLLVFGLAGCAFTYVIAPILDNLYSKIKPKIASILCVVLISLYLADLMYTKVNPNTGVGISEEVEKVDVK